MMTFLSGIFTLLETYNTYLSHPNLATFMTKQSQHNKHASQSIHLVADISEWQEKGPRICHLKLRKTRVHPFLTTIITADVAISLFLRSLFVKERVRSRGYECSRYVGI